MANLLESAEEALLAAEAELEGATNANGHAILAQLETQAAVEQAKQARDRVRAALAALRGEIPQVDVETVVKDDVGRMEAPVPLPPQIKKPEGPECPSCGKRGTLGLSILEIKGRELQVTACSNCSHQVW